MKNPIFIIVTVFIILGLVLGLWNKNHSPNETGIAEEKAHYGAKEIESSPNFLTKELLSDGSTQFLLSSDIPSRPHMYVMKGEQILIQRSVTNRNYPVKFSDYTKSYGDPQIVEELNKFYDPKAKLYVYPNEKIAFIANPETQEVLEQHVFTVSAEEYLKKYSERK